MHALALFFLDAYILGAAAICAVIALITFLSTIGDIASQKAAPIAPQFAPEFISSIQYPPAIQKPGYNPDEI